VLFLMSEVPLQRQVMCTPHIAFEARQGSGLQGYLAHMKTPTPLGPPEAPMHSSTGGSWGGAISFE